MTRAAKAKYYTTQFLELADAIKADPARIVSVDFENAAKTRTFRLEFYSFRACAEREGLGELYEELSAIVLLADGPTRLLIMHKDNTPNAIALKKALGK